MTQEELRDAVKEDVEGQLECTVCHKSIPKGVTENPQGEEYVGHFCGLDCLHKWEEEHPGEPVDPEAYDEEEEE